MPSPDDAPLLAVEDLGVAFSTRSGPVIGLRAASLTLAEGQTTTLIGESGSGKSLLGAAIAGLLPPDAIVSGCVRLAGANVFDLDEDARDRLRGRTIGFVPQSAGLSLNPIKTALAQVEEVYFRVNGATRTRARQLAEALLGDLGLSPEAARLHPHRLSGGMRQRVLVAIGLAAEPRLLIADEPTKGLDQDLRDDVVRLFQHVRRLRPKLALIVITHDLDVAEALGDRVGVLYAGMLVEDSPATAFFATPSHPYARRLLDASPKGGLVPIPGMPPEPGARIDGCVFAPRCLVTTDLCRRVAPLPVSSGGRRVACHHPEHAS